MNTAAKLGLYVLGPAGAFGGAIGVGHLAGSTGDVRGQAARGHSGLGGDAPVANPAGAEVSRFPAGLQPYLDAYGHLVALRGGDLAYLRVHSDGEPGDGKTSPGADITFYAEVPRAGTFRLYLDFQHQGKVRTAELTAHAGRHGAPEEEQ
jgi:hypothetical protein